MKARITLGFIAALLFCSHSVFAATIHVPADQPTIQAGIDAALPGDTVLLADGRYKGSGNKDLNFKGKAITVRSANGAQNCIIDCEGSGRGFYFHHGESRYSVVSGITITNGKTSSPGGGGILCEKSLPTIRDCILIGDSSLFGGGIYASFYDSPNIMNCTVVGNSAPRGGGLYSSGADYSVSQPIMINSVLWGNTPEEIYKDAYSTPTVSYCNVQGGTVGLGNFAAAPLFRDLENGDYHLSLNSPCKDVGTASGAANEDMDRNTRPQGSGIDVGAYEYTGFENSPPIITSFTSDIAQGDPPLEVVFTCLANDSDGEVTSFTIDCGDGSLNESNASGIFTHIYTSRGKSFASCTAADHAGAKAESLYILVDTRARAIIRVPSDYLTIQAAMDSASDGDTVLVANGTYIGEGNKNLDMKGKAITVRSENGPESSTIDCENDGGGFHFGSGETPSSVVSGFTIRNTDTGIDIAFSSPTIENNVIEDHRQYGSPKGIRLNNSEAIVQKNIVQDFNGYGIELYGGSPLVQKNAITRNMGGISVWASQPTITGNLINENGGYGIQIANTGAFLILNNVVVRNGSDGISYLIPSGSTNGAEIINNTIVGNLGSGISGNRDPYLKLTNNILVQNGNCGLEFSDSYDWGAPSCNYNNLWNNLKQDYCGLAIAGNKDASADPMFVDFFAGNYHLWPLSPCVDKGTNEGAPITDFEGDRRAMDGNGDGVAHPDIGADEARPPLSHDAAPHLTLSSGTEVKLGSPFTPTVRVLNVGTSLETVVTVVCEIMLGDTQIYADTRHVEKLASMSAVDSIFRRWTPEAVGDYEIKFSTILSGDENSENNLITRSLLVRELQAEFASNILEGRTPLEVHFTDLSTGTITTYLWDFGDGQTSNDKNPVHIYTKPGRYSVSLTVSGGALTDTEAKFGNISVLFDIFGMGVGNRWTYNGIYQATLPYILDKEVLRIDPSSFSVPTYVVEETISGSNYGSWYQALPGELRLWGTQEGGSNNPLKFSSGLTVAWFPAAVGNQRVTDATMVIEGYTVNVRMTVNLVAQELVNPGFGSLNTYKARYEFRLWNSSLGYDETDTWYYWMVPYLGIVKYQDSELNEDLTSFAIGEETVTHQSDADRDDLKDYQEILHGTDWLNMDSDGDGLTDGQEDVNVNGIVDAGERDPRVKDPTFGPDSANITNPYSPLSANMKLRYAGTGTYAGYGRYYQVIGMEVVDSVQCLKVAIKGHGNNKNPYYDTEWYTVWLAQDASGVVWLLKHYDALLNTYTELGRANAIVWAPPTFSVGQRVEEVGDSYREVVETGVTVNLGTGLGPYMNCVKVKCVEGADEDFIYLAQGVGIVKEEWNDGGLTNGWVLLQILTGAVADELVLNYGPAYGLYHYDQAGGWEQWNTANPSQMVPVDLNGDGTDELVAAFPGFGLYTYDSANGWQLINTVIPEFMSAYRNGIACDYGAAYGLWLWDVAGGWQQINTVDPEKMIAADIDRDGEDELVAGFIGYGLYTYDAPGVWMQINALVPDAVVRYSNGVVCDYGAARGLWSYSKSGGWVQLNAADPDKVVAVDIDNDSQDELVVSFVGYGLYTYEPGGSIWVQINTVIPDGMIPQGNGIAVDYGAAYGLWSWSLAGAWQQLNTADPGQMTVVDIDNDSVEELVVSFSGYGLYCFDETNGWETLNTVLPVGMKAINFYP